MWMSYSSASAVIQRITIRSVPYALSRKGETTATRGLRGGFTKSPVKTSAASLELRRVRVRPHHGSLLLDGRVLRRIRILRQQHGQLEQYADQNPQICVAHEILVRLQSAVGERE